MSLFFLLALGLLVGVASVFLGLGGGLFIVPLLNLFLISEPREAVATSVATVFLVTIINVWDFNRRRLIHWDVALVLGPISAVFAFITGYLAHWVPGIAQVIALTVILFGLGVYLVVRRKRLDLTVTQAAQNASRIRIWGLGIFAGVLSGFTGIGSGIVLTPLLLKWAIVKNDQSSPTSNAIMMFTTGAASLAYLWGPWTVQKLGSVHLDAVVLIFLGAQVLGLWGRRRQASLPQMWRERILATILFALGGATFYSIFSQSI